MMLDVPYGQGSVPVNIEDDRLAQVVRANEVEVGDEVTVLRSAMENPVGSDSFGTFMEESKDVLFIVNDATRPTPTAKVIDILYDDIKLHDVKFIVATGVHRAPTDEEYRWIFGGHYDEFKDRIFAHDAMKAEDMVYLGSSTNGTPMHVNKLGVEAERICIISSVEPHYFAGYTGGRKSFLPGIASFETIEQNHKYAMRAEAKALALHGNPVNEDMLDAIKVITDKKIFTINTVLDRGHRIYAATAGDIYESFHAAIDKANEVFSVPIREKADIVVTVAPYPMDIDLYQSQKALDNGKLALNPGGILILVSKCRMGVGTEDFMELMASASTPEGVMEKIAGGYKLGYHKAAKMAEIAQWASMWGVTDLDPQILAKAFITAKPSLQAAVDDALAEKPGGKILFMLDGSITVPRVEG